MSASASIVLPEPDSPTMPSVSPRSSVNETSFTGRTQPVGVGNSTDRLHTSSLVATEPIIGARGTAWRSFAV